MAAGLPDLVDCARLGGEAAVLTREFALGELPRLQDLLSEPRGSLRARYVFAKAASGRAAATVAVQGVPQLICQRCMQGFAFPVTSSSEVEFAGAEVAEAAAPERDLFVTRNGVVSLRELAEEELLLALPMAPVCDTPDSCGNAPHAGGEEWTEAIGELRRPFGNLQDLLKKT